MANKRMFSIDIVETDAFLELPSKSQLLYFHLGMRADDDGFVSSPRTIMRTTGCTARDLKRLEAAGYVISFDSGVLVVTDWKINNTLKNDRHHKTVFQNEFSLLKESTSKRYILSNSGTIAEPDRNQNGNRLEPQYSIEKNRVVVVKPAAAAPRTDSELSEIMQYFEQEIGILPHSAFDELQCWREVYPAEIIRAAIDEAAENNVRKWRYVDGVLKGWQKDGVRTLGDVEARREARKKPEQKERTMLT